MSFCESLQDSTYKEIYRKQITAEIIVKHNNILDIFYKLPTATIKKVAISICPGLTSLGYDELQQSTNEKFAKDLLGFCSDFGE